MYVIGQGHEHLGPGTSMVQFTNAAPGQYRGGLGCTGQFNTELTSDCKAMAAGAGLGCACGGKCGGCGLGLFDGGFDPSTWGWSEWGIVGLGTYMVFSTMFTTRAGGRAVRSGVKRSRKRLAEKIAG